MKIIGINDILELNRQLLAEGLDYKIHLQDACGAQSCRIERLESGGCEDQDQALYKQIEYFFKKNRMDVVYSADKSSFYIRQE